VSRISADASPFDVGHGWPLRCNPRDGAYRFGQDKEYLKKEGYQIMKDHVLWSLDWLVKDPRNAKLVAGPDYSPETAFALTEEDKKPLLGS